MSNPKSKIQNPKSNPKSDEMSGFSFTDLFDLTEIQKIQDAFALATGVASIITDPEGRPLTKPSNFCRLCRDIIRNTSKGLDNCMQSDAVLGRPNLDGPTMQPCLSGGLWDGGASICVGDHHIANWLIGQVRNEEQSEEQMMEYARQIGADEEEFRAALAEVKVMPTEQFEQVCQTLFLMARQMSQLAFSNTQQAHDIIERKQVEESLRESEERFRQVIISISDHIYVTEITEDGSQINRYLSPNIEALTGYPEEKFLTDWNFWPSVVLHPDDRPHAAIQAKRLALGQSSETEYRLIRADGQIIWVRDNAQVQTEGTSTVIYGLVSNITERKHLEQQIQESLDRRGRQVQTSTEMAQEIAAVPALDELFRHVVNLVQARLGYYYVHIYTLEEDNLVIQNGTGEAGRQLKATGYKIALAAKKSLIARAARSGVPVLMTDVYQAPDWLPHSLLPDTKSEIAVPIKLGDKVLGVLDVQSDTIGGLSEEDQLLLMGLCGQIAVAIDNRRAEADRRQAELLLSKRIKELNYLNDLGREIAGSPPVPKLLQWAVEHITLAMQYPELCVAAMDYNGRVYGTPEAIELPCQITHTMRISDEAMGRIYISYTEKRDFLDEESALLGDITRRVSSYVESKRLFEQTQDALAGQERLAIQLDSQRTMFQTVLQSMPAGVFVAEAPTGKPILANKQAEEMLGRGISPEATTEELEDVYAIYRYGSDEPYAQDKTPLARGMFGETAAVDDMEIRHPDGSNILLQVFGAPIKDHSGQITASVAIFQDITERKQAEEALREGEKRYRRLFEDSPISLWEEDFSVIKTYTDKLRATGVEDFRSYFDDHPEDVAHYANLAQVIDINQDTLKIYQAKDKTEFFAGLSKVFSLEALDTFKEEIIAIAENKTRFVGESIHYTLRGSKLYVVLNWSVVPGHESTFSRVMVSVTDITERRQAEETLSRRANELQAVAQVGTAAATILEANKLLQKATDLTKSNFKLYHAHIYLLDDSGNTLVLAAGAGDVGQQMVAEGWNIPLDREHSLVARVARTQQGIIANNVRQSPDWLPNPLLPDTRSELAVPLIAGAQVLGVLDVQADVVNHFTEEDVRIQTTLAAQVAVALQNARSFERSERAIKELNAMTRRLTREGWKSYLDDVDTSERGYVYDLQQVSPLRQADPQAGESASPAQESKIEQPLTVQGETVGRLSLVEPQTLTNEAAGIVDAVAARLSTHLENLRLSEQTARALDQTESLYIASDRVIRAPTTGDILLALVESTAIQQFDRANIILFDKVWDDRPPEGFTVTAVWEQSGKPSREPVGTHYKTEQVPFVFLIERDKPIFIPDITVDERVDEYTRAILSERLGIKSLSIFPLIAGEQWIGMLSVQASTLMELTEDHIRQISSLTDQAATVIQSQRLFEQAQQRAAELEETTGFLDSIVENMPSGIFVKDAQDLRFVEWNKASEELFGLKKEEMIGKTDYDFFPKEEADFFVATDRKVLAGGKMVVIPEEPVHTPHKGLLLMHTRKTPIFGADGKLKYLVGFSEDITERKRTEEALLRNEEAYRSLYTNTPAMLHSLDENRQIVNVSDYWLEVFGYERDEIIGRRATEFLTEESKRYAETAVMPEFLKTGQARDIPYQFIKKDGQLVDILLSAITERDAEDQFTRSLFVLTDVTERNRLLAEVERLAAIVENHPDFIGVGTLDGQSLYINPAGLKMMDLPPDHDVTTMDTSHFYPAADAKKLTQEGIPTALEKGSWSSEANLLRSDGITIPVEETVGINYDADGNPVSFSITMRDITERKTTEAERERLLSEVEVAYRQYVRREWEQFLGERHQGGWQIEHQRTGLKSASSEEILDKLKTEVMSRGQIKAIAGPEDGGDGAEAAIVAPISLRGQVIGALSLQDFDPDRRWTDEDKALVEAVSEQLALTVENLRLFEGTQQRAAREQITRQITDKMRAAPDVDSIIQTGLDELAKTLDVSRTYVKLTFKPGQTEPDTSQIENIREQLKHSSGHK